MEALSSSFTHPQLLHVPSFRMNVKRSRPMIKANIIKKLLQKNTTTSQTFENLKNNPPPSNQLEITNKKPLVTTILNRLDDFITAYLDPSPLRPGIDPKHSSSGYYAPVDELPPTACEVVVAKEGGYGPLPSCLNGAYIRNGPNPQFTPKGRPYHLFDGDGMLHMIRISQGKATFCSRYVKTHKYTVERENGHPFVPSPFSTFNGLAASAARCVLTVARVLSGQFDPLSKGLGAANTSVALLPNGLFALSECDLPYELKVTEEGDIITLGRCDFHSGNNNNPLLFSNMTAHPKMDRQTGETFAYRCNISRPFLTLFRIDVDGRKQKDVPIFSVKGFTIIHDFSVTENYAIFVDTQIVVDLSRVLGGRLPVGVDRDKVPMLGVIGKYAEDEREMWWAEAQGLNMFHSVNAWEEDGGDTIVAVVSNALEVEKLFESIGFAQSRLEKITIDVKAKTLQREPLSEKVLEFGAINPAYAGKKNRYVYASMIGPKGLDGMVKLDLSLTYEDGRDCIVAKHLYGSGFCGGEPSFVSREPNNPMAEEDDGYLVTYVNDETIIYRFISKLKYS